MKSTILLLLGLLAAASCLACCEAGGLFSSTKEADSLSPLNELLVELTNELGLKENVKAARRLRWEPDFERRVNGSLEVAVKLFSELNTDNLCETDNFRLIRQLLWMGNKKNRKEIRRTGSQRRLIRLLHEFTHDAKWRCFRPFQELWALDYERTLRFMFNFRQLEEFTPFLIRHAKRRLFEDYEDAKQLNGAVELLHSSDPEKLFTGWEIKSILVHIHKLKTGFRSLKVDEKSGKSLRLDIETARQSIDKYLVQPCKELMRTPEVESIFEPMTNLAAIVRVDDLVRSSVAKKGWPALEWTARYIMCDLLIGSDHDKLAERVSKSIL